MTSSDPPADGVARHRAGADKPARTGTPPPAQPRESLWEQARIERRAQPPQKNVPSPHDARGPSYARFIPREELNSFAAWQPGNLAGGPEPQANMRRRTDAPREHDVTTELASQLRAARDAGYQDGYRDGLVALDGFKQSFASQMTAQIGTLLASLDSGLADLQQDMARTLAIAATQLARQIVRAELDSRPELIVGVAQEAVDTLLLSARHITLRVHPDDQPLVAQGAAEVLAARGARLLADASMTRGGCTVESDIGIVDASVETRWRRVAATLGCDAAWGADAPAGTPADTAR